MNVPAMNVPPNASMSSETCTVTADCSNPYHICDKDGFCDCEWMRATSGPECSVESAKAKTFLALVILYVIMWIAVSTYQVRALTQVLCAGKRGAVRKFAVFVTIGLVAAMIREMCRLVSIVSPDSYGSKPSETSQLLDQPLLTIASSTFIAGAMCQGLMWIEFVLASKRMAQMGNDLRFSAHVLNGLMVTYVTLSSLFTILLLFVTPFGFTLWLLLTMLVLVLISGCYLFGAHKMSLVYLRISSDLKKEATQMHKTLTTTVDSRVRTTVEEFSATEGSVDTEQSEQMDQRHSRQEVDDEEEEEERKELERDRVRRQTLASDMFIQAAGFNNKAQRTLQCARTVARGLLVNMTSVLIWEGVNRLKLNQPIIWLFLTLSWVGLWVASYAMTSYCLFTTRVTRVAPSPPAAAAAYQA